MKSLGSSVVPIGDEVCVTHQDEVVGSECRMGGPSLALVNREGQVIGTRGEYLRLLVRQHQHVFADKAQSTIRCAPVRVFLTKKTPFKAKPARFSRDDLLVLKKLLVRWETDNIIEDSTSPYCSTAHFVPRKNGEPRLVTNYIPMNRRVVWDNYPLPSTVDMLQSLEGAKYSSALNLAEGFMQVPLNRQDRHKLAFVTPLGMFQFTRLPYGYINAPSAFQRVMNDILWEGLYKRCVVYIDDILLFGSTYEEQRENLEWVLNKCAECNVKLRLSKCQFGVEKVDFLGFQLSGDGIAPCLSKFDAVFDNVPTSKEEVKTLLGKLGFYSRFIEGFSTITRPLRMLARKKEPFAIGREHIDSLKKLETNLQNAECQFIPAKDSRKIVDLITRQQNIEVLIRTEHNQIIGRASQLLTDTEARYTSAEKAILALILAYRHYRSLLSSNTVFKTSIKDLPRIMTLVNMPERVERLLLRLPPDVNPHVIGVTLITELYFR